MLTQNLFQSRRIDFGEQIPKSCEVIVLDGEKVLQSRAV